MVALAGILWAGSGTAAQHFFAHSRQNAMALTNIRMILAGLLLLLLAWRTGYLKKGLAVLRAKPRLWAGVAVFAVGGIFLVQYTYFRGIAAGNAAATTTVAALTCSIPGSCPLRTFETDQPARPAANASDTRSA